MANEVKVLDTIEVTDLEDNSKLTVVVRSCSEMGNKGVPGIQFVYMGYFVNFEPLQVEKWAYQARVEVKTRSKAKPVVRQYPLPFNIEE